MCKSITLIGEPNLGKKVHGGEFSPGVEIGGIFSPGVVHLQFCWTSSGGNLLVQSAGKQIHNKIISTNRWHFVQVDIEQIQGIGCGRMNALSKWGKK